jgi:CheY-like chemotaxis protein
MLEANDAEIGIQLVREQRPDLVLMDIQLPGMDGLSATKIIKEDPDLKDIPIVALTSYAMQGDKEKALAAGCTGYIAKPIDTRKFLGTISQYLKDDDL